LLRVHVIQYSMLSQRTLEKKFDTDLEMSIYEKFL